MSLDRTCFEPHYFDQSSPINWISREPNRLRSRPPVSLRSEVLMRKPLRILGATVAVSLAAAAVPLLASSEAQAVKFTGGNLVVYRVGSGAGTLSNAAAPVFLDEFSAAGAKVSSVALPTAAAGANRPLTAVGQSRSEGLIANSPDGKLVSLTGYAAAPGVTGPGG